MSARSIIEEFRRLSPNEKIRLVHELWNEIADEGVQLSLTDSQLRLLDERLAEHEAHPEDAELWETARDEVLHNL